MSECQQHATYAVTLAPRWKYLWCQHGITDTGHTVDGPYFGLYLICGFARVWRILFYVKFWLTPRAMRSDTQNALFYPFGEDSAHLLICVCILMMTWQQWRVIPCGKLRKKGKFLKVLLLTGGHLVTSKVTLFRSFWCHIIIMLSSTRPQCLWFLDWGKNCVNFRSGRFACTPASFYNSETGPRLSDRGHRVPGACVCGVASGLGLGPRGQAKAKAKPGKQNLSKARPKARGRWWWLSESRWREAHLAPRCRSGLGLGYGKNKPLQHSLRIRYCKVGYEETSNKVSVFRPDPYSLGYSDSHAASMPVGVTKNYLTSP